MKVQMSLRYLCGNCEPSVWCSEERCGLEMQTEKLSAQRIVFKARKLCEVTQSMTIGQEKRADP